MARADYKLKSFINKNEIARAIQKKEYSEKELRKEYSRLRSQIVKQIKRTQASDLPYLPGKVPTPPTIKELTGPLGVNMQQLIYEAGEMVKLIHSKSYTREQRVAQRAMAVSIMNKRGINITVEQYADWRKFMEWFKQTEFSALYDSTSAETLDVFTEGSTAEQWELLVEEWMQKQHPEDYAKMIEKRKGVHQ